MFSTSFRLTTFHPLPQHPATNRLVKANIKTPFVSLSVGVCVSATEGVKYNI